MKLIQKDLADLDQKILLLRLDLNVPIKNEKIQDFNHNPHSSIFDLTQTQVVKNKFSRVLSWYDNEWGFSNTMCDTAIQISKLI